jgi:hypothetical protein
MAGRGRESGMGRGGLGREGELGPPTFHMLLPPVWGTLAYHQCHWIGTKISRVHIINVL